MDPPTGGCSPADHRALAQVVAGGEAARYYTPDGTNALGERVGLVEAATGERAFAVQLRTGLLAIDVDGSREAVELLWEAAELAEVVPPVASRPGGIKSGHAHLLLNLGPAAAAVFAPVVAEIAQAMGVQYGCGVDLRRGGQKNAWLRPPGSPHRTGGRGELPHGWSGERLAAALTRRAANPYAAAQLMAILLVRLGLHKRWSARLAVAAYPPSQAGTDPLERYQQALTAAPAARGMGPADPASAEMCSLKAVTAGLDAGLDHARIAADLLTAPAGTKARTRASGRARARPHRWARQEVARLARKHRTRSQGDAQPRLVDDQEQAWRDRLAAARRAVAALEGFGRRTDRIRATATELLTRAERLQADQRGDQVTVQASWRSLGTAIARHHSTAEAAVGDLEELGVLTCVEPGEPATCRASRLTLDLTHELFAPPKQEVRQGALHAPRGGVGHVGDPLSDFRRHTLDRHDAWRLIDLTGVVVEAPLGAARPIWWRLLAVGGGTVEQMAEALGLRATTVGAYACRLAEAGLAREHEGGVWHASAASVAARLDRAARVQDTVGAGLVAALRDAAASAEAHMCSRARDDEQAATSAPPAERPPPPEEPPGGDTWALADPSAPVPAWPAGLAQLAIFDRSAEAPGSVLEEHPPARRRDPHREL